MAAVADPGLARLSKDAAALGMKPLWERVARLAPGTAAQPAIWRWSDTRPLLLRACELITARQAERRVLMLENPALAGTTFATTTLFTGLQAILPGEIAPTHRHTPNALRLIIEGGGAYTAVDGERIAMNPGDFIVTPGWSWHDHGNEGAAPVIWLDGLDTALANLFGAHFREDYPQEKQPSRAAADSLLSFPYEQTRSALERLSRSGNPDPSHGWKLRYSHPVTGRDPFPTMAVSMQWLPRGFAGRACRSTDGAVYCVVEGRGRAEVGSARFELAPHDVLAVPSWEVHRFDAVTDCVMFSYSDRAAQEALAFWREEHVTP